MTLGGAFSIPQVTRAGAVDPGGAIAVCSGRPLFEVMRMATLTPARIAGREAEIGSLATGKRADFLVLDRELRVREVYRDGVQIVGPSASR